MKKIFSLFLILPILVFSQVSSWRSSSPSSTQSPSKVQSPSNNSSGWRNYSPREFNKPRPTKPGSNIIIYNTNPYYNNWGWNNWGAWGAPMYGFNNYYPFWYDNPYGYRQPARVYVYDNNKTDTIFGKKPVINFGLSMTNTKQIGGFFAIGNKGYFILDFITTYKPDNSTYFPYGTLSQVDFPLISDLKKQRTFYIGGGKRFNRTGVHAMIGFGSENVYYRGYDSYGEITFPKFDHSFTTVKLGTMYDLKHFTLKIDFDPFRNCWQLGLGVNL